MLSGFWFFQPPLGVAPPLSFVTTIPFFISFVSPPATLHSIYCSSPPSFPFVLPHLILLPFLVLLVVHPLFAPNHNLFFHIPAFFPSLAAEFFTNFSSLMLVPHHTMDDVCESAAWFLELRIFLDPFFDHMSVLWFRPHSRQPVALSGVFRSSSSSGCHGGVELGGSDNDDDY